MKYGIISDIHSDIDRFNNVLKFLKSRSVNHILCCGDMIGYGQYSKEVIQSVITNNIKSVSGNHEKGFLNKSDYMKMNDRAKIAIYVTQQLLSSEHRKFIENLPDSLIENKFRVVHGVPPDSVFSYIDEVPNDELKNIFKQYPEVLTFCGHTHVPRLIKYSWRGISIVDKVEFDKPYLIGSFKRCIVNVGSVSEPRDTEDYVSRFVIYDNIENSVTFHQIYNPQND